MTPGPCPQFDRGVNEQQDGDIDDQDDQTLLARVRDGHEPSLEQLVRRHSPALHRRAAAILGDAVLADDVVQDTWLAALRGLDGFAGRSSARSWLLAICANTARTRRGTERRWLPFSATWRDDRAPALEVGTSTGSGAWAAPVTEWDDAPHAAAATSALHRQLVDAVDALPPRQRTVVVACDVLDLPGAEVASMLGVSPAHQRVLLHQARARLRVVLAEHRGVVDR